VYEDLFLLDATTAAETDHLIAEACGRGHN